MPLSILYQALFTNLNNVLVNVAFIFIEQPTTTKLQTVSTYSNCKLSYYYQIKLGILFIICFQ